MTAQPVTLALIEDAAKRIAPFVRGTPLQGGRQLGEMFGCTLRFKCENLQKAGVAAELLAAAEDVEEWGLYSVLEGH